MATHVNVSFVRRMTHATLFGYEGLIIQCKKKNTFYNVETEQLLMILPQTEVVGVLTLDGTVTLIDAEGDVRDIVESVVSPSLLQLNEKIRYSSGDRGVVAVATLSDGYCTITQHGGRTSCNLHRAGRKRVVCLQGVGGERESQGCRAVLASCLLHDMCPMLARALLPGATHDTTHATKRARLATPHEAEAVFVGLATGDLYCLVALPGGQVTEARLVYRCETQGVLQVVLLEDPEASGRVVVRVGVVCGGGLLTVLACHPSSLCLSFTPLYLPCAALDALAIPGRSALVTADGSALMRHFLVPHGPSVALSSEVLTKCRVSFLAAVKNSTSAFALTVGSVLLRMDLLSPPLTPARAVGAEESNDSNDSKALSELYARLEAQERALDGVQRALRVETQRCQALGVCLRGRFLRDRFQLSAQVENVSQLVDYPNNFRGADMKDDLAAVVIKGDMSIDDEVVSDVNGESETMVEDDVADRNLAARHPPRPTHCNAAGSYVVHLTVVNHTGLVFPAPLWTLQVTVHSAGEQRVVARPLTEEMATLPLTWRIPCRIAAPLTASLQCSLVLCPGVGAGGGRAVDLGSCPIDPSCFFYAARDGMWLAGHLALSRLQRYPGARSSTLRERCRALKPALCRRSLSLTAVLTHAGLAAALAANTYSGHKGSVVPTRSSALPRDVADATEATRPKEVTRSREVTKSRGVTSPTAVTEVTSDLPREVVESLEVNAGRVSLFVGSDLVHLYLAPSGANLTVTCHSNEVLDAAVRSLSKLLCVETC